MLHLQSSLLQLFLLLPLSLQLMLHLDSFSLYLVSHLLHLGVQSSLGGRVGEEAELVLHDLLDACLVVQVEVHFSVGEEHDVEIVGAKENKISVL